MFNWYNNFHGFKINYDRSLKRSLAWFTTTEKMKKNKMKTTSKSGMKHKQITIKNECKVPSILSWQEKDEGIATFTAPILDLDNSARLIIWISLRRRLVC